MATSSYLSRLETLDLSNNGIDDEDVEALEASPNLRCLTRLNLAQNRIRSAGIRALVNSPHLARLRVLDIRGNAAVGNKAREAVKRRFGKENVKW